MVTAGPYRLAADRYYERESHLWIARRGEGRMRCGFDPLGSETAGDIVAVSFEAVGTRVARGEAFGTIEAAKFVGPLLAPLSGRLVAHNREVLANPALINRDPLAAWLVELEAGDEAELVRLLHGGEEIRAWFEAEIDRYRREGLLAE